MSPSRTRFQMLVTYRELRRATRMHHDFGVWLRDGIRAGKLGDRIDFHARLALLCPREYSQPERDHIFLEHAKTESFLAIKHGLVSDLAARELMARDPWCAFRFCPDKVPQERYEAWAVREPRMARIYAAPGGWRAGEHG